MGPREGRTAGHVFFLYCSVLTGAATPKQRHPWFAVTLLNLDIPLSQTFYVKLKNQQNKMDTPSYFVCFIRQGDRNHGCVSTRKTEIMINYCIYINNEIQLISKSAHAINFSIVVAIETMTLQYCWCNHSNTWYRYKMRSHVGIKSSVYEIGEKYTMLKCLSVFFCVCTEAAYMMMKSPMRFVCVMTESTSQMAYIMTSSNGNILRVTGHLCGEFTGHWWIPRTKASDA